MIDMLSLKLRRELEVNWLSFIWNTDDKREVRFGFWKETPYGWGYKDMLQEKRGFTKYEVLDENEDLEGRSVSVAPRTKELVEYKYDRILLLVGRCDGCDMTWLVPRSCGLPYFQCPQCSSEEERALLEVLYFINPDSQSYQKCPGCDEYGLIDIRVDAGSIHFKCPGCSEGYELKRKNELELERYSASEDLFSCDRCGKVFTHTRPVKGTIGCFHCSTKGEKV